MSKLVKSGVQRDDQSTKKRNVNAHSKQSSSSVETYPPKNLQNPTKGKSSSALPTQKPRYRSAKHNFMKNPHMTGYSSVNNDGCSQQRSSKFTPHMNRSGFPSQNSFRLNELKRLEENALHAVEALRIRGVDYMKDLEDNIEVHEDSSRCFVQLPAELYDALQEDLLNPNEVTLVYKAFQPLVGMVFGKRGNAANFLHQMGATLELANKDCFRIKCPRSQAQVVQEYFEGKLANILVRMNKDNVTVVMRPEKLMIMLSPFTLTPVVVLGMLTSQLLVLRIYDPQYEKIFADVHRDIQAFYGSLTSEKLMEHRLSLPITPGTLACFFDEKSCIFMRAVVEEVVEDEATGEEMRVRIWRIDYGSFEWVSVNRLYRLQTCYLQVPRQCFVVRLLFAKKCITCPLSPLDIFMQYFSGGRFFALSVMENPSDLSHVILFSQHTLNQSTESDSYPRIEDLSDIMDTLVEHQVYQISAYNGPDFSVELESSPLKTAIPYGQLCRDMNRDSSSTTTSLNKTSTSSNSKSLTSAETNLQDLVNPYVQQPQKRHILKYRGLVLSDGERNLRMRSTQVPIDPSNSVAVYATNGLISHAEVPSSESLNSGQFPALIDSSNSFPQSFLPYAIAPPLVNMPFLIPYFAPYAFNPEMCFTSYPNMYNSPINLVPNYPFQNSIGGSWAGIASSLPSTSQSSMYDPAQAYTYVNTAFVPYTPDLL